MLLCPTQFFRLNEVQPKLKTIPLVSNESILFQVRQITYGMSLRVQKSGDKAL
jgi:hypothetical protein